MIIVRNSNQPQRISRQITTSDADRIGLDGDSRVSEEKRFALTFVDLTIFIDDANLEGKKPLRKFDPVVNDNFSNDPRSTELEENPSRHFVLIKKKHN